MKSSLWVTAMAGILNSGTVTATDPLLDSWYTKDAGKYARIWPTIADETTEKTTGTTTSLTTWNRANYPANNAGFAAGDQTMPVYAGVQEISHSTNYVYIRSSGLGTHTMGPWYDNNLVRDTLFASFPGNARILYRFPRTTSYGPSFTSPKQATRAGSCGLFVNGVPLFNTSDTFSYSFAAGKDAGPGTGVAGSGDGVWNRDAFVNEGPTFDAGNSHQAMEQHHYHANPPALRHLLGDSVDHDPKVVFKGLVSQGGASPYTEKFNGRHSPIIGWVNDGLPMYGPYGYGDPTDTNSAVRRMVSGYQKRDGSNGSYDLRTNGRNRLPQWSVTLAGKSSTTVAANQMGPAVSTAFTLGHYMEDYDFKGDLTGLRRYQGVTAHGVHNPATDYDLNEYNTRYCVTPEFPNGTWAYFTAIETNGDPTFPYNLSWAYFGNSTAASSVTTISEIVTPYFSGPTNLAPRLNRPEVSGGMVTLTWSASEGGTYRVESSTGLDGNWTTNATGIAAVSNTGKYIATDGPDLGFFRVAQTSLAVFDPVTSTATGGGGGGAIVRVSPTSGARGTAFTLTITLPNTAPPANVPINSVTVGALIGTANVHVSQTQVTSTITIPADAATGPQTVTVIFPGPPGSAGTTEAYTLANAFTIN